MSKHRFVRLVQVAIVFTFLSSAVFAQDTTLVKLILSLDTISTIERRVDTWVQIAYVTSDKSVDDANLYLDSASELAISNNYELGVANVTKQRASVQILSGDYASALNYLSTAQTMFRELKDSSQLAKTYNLLGNIYSITHNYTEALRYYRNARSLFSSLNDYKSLAVINNNIGIIYSELDQMDSASIYYNMALMTYLELKDQKSLAGMYTNIGTVYAENDDLEKAIEYYNKSNVTLKELNQAYGQSINYLNIGDAYIHLEDYEKAVENLEIAIEIAEKEGFKSLLSDEYYTVGEIKEAEGDYKTALEWYRKSEVMEDSLLNSETKSALIDTQTQQLEQIQKSELEKINLINKGNLQEQKLKNTLLLVVSASILILLLLATAYFYKRAKVARTMSNQNFQILNQKSKIFEQAKSISEKNESLLEKNVKLEELNEEKNYIVNVVAHDLKSPLNQIQGLAEVIRLEEGSLSDTQKECLSNISTSSQRLSGMINRILDTRAIESDKMEYQASSVELFPILDQIISDFQPLADQKEIELEVSSNLEPAIVKGDVHYIQQVIENIISNSIKFSPLNKKVEIACSIEDNRAILSFKDQGPGLTEKDRKKLFVEYANLSAKPTGSETSTGLGLSIVKKYVDLMGGDIWCENNDEEGATFYLTFNLA